MGKYLLFQFGKETSGIAVLTGTVRTL